MKKDAYYFSHDSNAKDDPKCMLLIEQLGLEGYGIFWVLVEILRDQSSNSYPINLLPAIARRYNTTHEKIKTVVFNYGLFIVEDDNIFYSESLNRRMDSVNMLRINGIKGSLIKYKYVTKEQAETMTDSQIVELQRLVNKKEVSPLHSPLHSPLGSPLHRGLIARKESKRKEKKVKESIREENIRKEEIIEPKTIKTKFNFSKELVDYGFDPLLVSDFMQIRKEKKATNTKTAFNSFIREVEKSKIPKNECLIIVIENSWRSFKAEWLKNTQKCSSNQLSIPLHKNIPDGQNKAVRSDILSNNEKYKNMEW